MSFTICPSPSGTSAASSQFRIRCFRKSGAQGEVVVEIHQVGRDLGSALFLIEEET
jgi:hypothetical protein